MSIVANDTHKVYTVGDWLFDCVNFTVPSSAVNYVCACRGVEYLTEYDEYTSNEENVDIRLLKADLYKWILLGPSKVNNTSDSDNGWSHSDGGYTLSKDDKKLLMDEANKIYKELEPESVFGKRKVRMHSAGIMPAYRDMDGNPIPREIQ
ncbi:hypothetical protein [Prevotella sp. E2-28]|uniref:hypothetical protein n=1 Tax=Prevotella sp. E2-28 TaxID=2913620 RepID=UPI001EDB0FEB|nr:hypothetical protein [Prevotella sp. E2-28]UKK52669.1 hypothetical protein L6465_08625 [Prevotella sp. E2-28]